MLYLQPCQVLWEPGSLLVKTWRAVNTCCWRSVWPSLTGFHSVKLPKNKMIHAAIKRYIPPLQWCSVNDSSVPNLTFNHTNTCLSAERQVPWRLCCFRWSLLVEAKLLIKNMNMWRRGTNKEGIWDAACLFLLRDLSKQRTPQKKITGSLLEVGMGSIIDF